MTFAVQSTLISDMARSSGAFRSDRIYCLTAAATAAAATATTTTSSFTSAMRAYSSIPRQTQVPSTPHRSHRSTVREIKPVQFYNDGT